MFPGCGTATSSASSLSMGSKFFHLTRKVTFYGVLPICWLWLKAVSLKTKEKLSNTHADGFRSTFLTMLQAA